MPAAAKYPIDDNTLFILLALRYQGEIKIMGWESLYDNNVNYDETIINPEISVLSTEEKGERLLKFIQKEFEIYPGELEGNTIILKAPDNSKVESYLKKYLSEFTQFKNYYYTEERHKNRLYHFIKEKFSEVLEFSDKYFTYKFLPDDDKEKYKMIEYIGALINKGLLQTGDDTFTFNVKENALKKVIKLKSVDRIKIAKLFYSCATEEDRKLFRKILGIETIKKEGEYFTLFMGNKISLNSDIMNPMDIDPRYEKVFLFCLEYEQSTFSAEDYIAYHEEKYNEKVLASTVKKYFPETNNKIKAKLDFPFDIITNLRKNKWLIKLKP